MRYSSQAKETSPRTRLDSNSAGKPPRLESDHKQRLRMGSFEPSATLLEVSMETDSAITRQHSPDIAPKEEFIEKPRPLKPLPLEDEPDILEHKPLPRSVPFTKDMPPPRPPLPITEVIPPKVPHPPSSVDSSSSISGSETSVYDFDISSSEREYSTEDDEVDYGEEPDHAHFLGKSVR